MGTAAADPIRAAGLGKKAGAAGAAPAATGFPPVRASGAGSFNGIVDDSANAEEQPLCLDTRDGRNGARSKNVPDPRLNRSYTVRPGPHAGIIFNQCLRLVSNRRPVHVAVAPSPASPCLRGVQENHAEILPGASGKKAREAAVADTGGLTLACNATCALGGTTVSSGIHVRTNAEAGQPCQPQEAGEPSNSPRGNPLKPHPKGVTAASIRGLFPALQRVCPKP